LFVIIGTYAFLSSKSDEKEEKNTKEKAENGQSVETAKKVDKEKEMAKIQDYFYIHNQGQIAKEYSYDDAHYLMIVQTSNVTYGDQYIGNKVIWVESKNGKITTEELNEGTHLVGVANEKGSPYWEVEGQTFFVFYEHVKQPSSGYSYHEKGYVYQVKENGEIEKVYETKEAFDDFVRTKNGSVLLTEKVYQDEKNSYPIIFKPYELRYVQYISGKWKTVKKEMKHPEKEQIEKEEKELEKNRGPQDPYQATS
jgi:hypothetical protein